MKDSGLVLQHQLFFLFCLIIFIIDIVILDSMFIWFIF